MQDQETLEKILQDTFSKVTEKFGIPLKKVEYDENVDTACISMESFEIKVNPKFIESTKLDFQMALEAVLDHEVGHYLYHPHSLKRLLQEHMVVKKLPDGQMLQHFYADVNDNLRVMHARESKLDQVYKALNPESRVERVLLKLYQEYTHKDFGVNHLERKLQEALEQLKTINFLNFNANTKEIEYVKKSDAKNKRDLKKFYDILHPLLKEDKKEELQGMPTLGKSPNIKDYSSKEIRKVLKELVQERQWDKDDIKEFVKEFEDKFKDQKGQFPGGNYNGDPESFANRFVYESLALNYRITLKKTPLISTNGQYPTSLTKYEVGDNLLDIDPFSSLANRILPGISNKFVKEQIKYHGQKEKTPDLVLLLDDSGSMPNPNEEISDAVLGSFVIAREYLENGASVGIAHFSDRTSCSTLSNNMHEVMNNLLVYKNGSDTQINLKEIEKHFQNICDYVLITDGHIRNRDSVIDYLNSKALQGARAYMIQIGRKQNIHYEGKIKVFDISSADNLGNIVLDDMHGGV